MADGSGRRTEVLEVEHKKLDDALKQEASRPMPDFAVTQTLKRQKLKIKDELLKAAPA